MKMWFVIKLLYVVVFPLTVSIFVFSNFKYFLLRFVSFLYWEVGDFTLVRCPEGDYGWL